MFYKELINSLRKFIEIYFCLYFFVVSCISFVTIPYLKWAVEDDEPMMFVLAIIIYISILCVSYLVFFTTNAVSLKNNTETKFSIYLKNNPCNFIYAHVFLFLVALLNATFLLCFISWLMMKNFLRVNSWSELTAKVQNTSFKNISEKEIGVKISKGDWDGVIKDCTDNITTKRFNVDFCRLTRASAYYKIGKFDNALKDINIAISILEEQIKMVGFLVDCSVHYYQLGSRYYTRAKIYYKLNNFIEAQKDINTAIGMGYTTRAVYSLEKMIINVLELKNEIIKEETISIQEASNDNNQQEIKPINIETCDKKDLLLLEEFSNEKVEKFIKERKRGMKWYDLYSFCEYFEFQPHEMIELEGKLIFPLKEKTRSGRRIDI